MSCIDSSLWVKICGLTEREQAIAIAQLGAHAIGLICVPSSPRYVTPPRIQAMSQALAAFPAVERVGVFANASLAAIAETVEMGQLTAIQLHGQESPATCAQLRHLCPGVTLIKAFRLRSATDLAATAAYQSVVDRLLLDAYHPQQLGGTGRTLDWASLQAFRPPIPWVLAGGLTPDNVTQALTWVSPDGIDVSSGVEVRPGYKALEQVARLFEAIRLGGVGEWGSDGVGE